MTTAAGLRPPATLRVGLVGSVVVHVLALAALWLTRGEAPPALPPVYRVELIAAPQAATAASVASPSPDVSAEAPSPPAPTPALPTPVAAPATRAKSVPAAKAKIPPKAAKPVPKAATTAAARTASAKLPPAAAPIGAAATSTSGGAGTDVANVRTDGIAFPFPGYLQNIVRQVAARFRPRNPNAPLKADVAFLIHRDGSVSSVRFVTRSGSYAFDLEAQGAIEAAAGAKAFGPLPTGFADDVLPVTFAFDPRVLR